MQPFPHRYDATASATHEGLITVNSEDFPSIATNAPAQFGGAGDHWSPEELMMAAVADCFCLSFRAIARASKLEWSNLSAKATGTLDRVERVTCFTGVTVHATLTLAAGADAEKAQRLLEKAESSCLITNSMNCDVQLETDIR